MRDRKWHENQLKEIYDAFNDAVECKDLDIWELCYFMQELHRCWDIIELAVKEGIDSDIIDRFKELACQMECFIWKRWL